MIQKNGRGKGVFKFTTGTNDAGERENGVTGQRAEQPGWRCLRGVKLLGEDKIKYPLHQGEEDVRYYLNSCSTPSQQIAVLSTWMLNRSQVVADSNTSTSMDYIIQQQYSSGSITSEEQAVLLNYTSTLRQQNTDLLNAWGTYTDDGASGLVSSSWACSIPRATTQRQRAMSVVIFHYSMQICCGLGLQSRAGS
ncbi:hypothetical protein CEUSTIGMA_g8384.t1 [Chlamydomonas eustigma]|uniref:Uncharacterized protein n=1 Tax=Chlamydomonas eustigma TaxID=1157962 RepID=A0A250XDF9_9CHLO|nr:hypothetical protein CEUSTIGMA_g8384.t1 [Chlamydomonas eustigma]|eukprot:GAX80949.1 hypothetical protein CEUSTIGMA_g8384.t1 [Chlamydomonas eustigma]